MTATITALRPKERVCQDSEPVAVIYRDLGTVAAEQLVTRALGELALTMSGMVAQVRRHDLADMTRQLRRLQQMADQLGLVSLGLVATDVRHCLAAGDVTAFSAVWARLLRVAERSLAVDGDLLGRTI